MDYLLIWCAILLYINMYSFFYETPVDFQGRQEEDGIHIN